MQVNSHSRLLENSRLLVNNVKDLIPKSCHIHLTAYGIVVAPLILLHDTDSQVHCQTLWSAAAVESVLNWTVGVIITQKPLQIIQGVG